MILLLHAPVWYGGSITALGPTGDFSTGSCEKNNLRDPAMTYRGPDPPVGDAFYFMFRGQISCPGGTGTWGTPNRDATAALSSSPCR